ncbi:hypothetical protein F5888DRAFT_264711 [Russula emetica]|nr:hypothetical protein F5888DRAFT_264711 [Russula emetica]
MVLLASAGLSSSSSPMSSWPRMQSGQKNPFQNAPGPFIYALPNLAGTCPYSYSDTALLGSFSSGGDSSNAFEPEDPHHQHQHHPRCHSPDVTSRCFCCHHDPTSDLESAEPPSTAATKEESAPDTESPSPLPPPPSAPSLSPSDEIHFGLGDDIDPSSESLTEGGNESLAEQRQESQSSSVQSTSSTPTQSSSTNAQSSPTRSDFQEGSKEEGGEGGLGGEGRKKRARGRRARRKGRRNGRSKHEHGGSSIIAPRFMGLSGIPYYGIWAQYVCPQAPPQFPPPAMNHGFVIPPNSLAPQFWNPMVPGLAPGFVGVPVAS